MGEGLKNPPRFMIKNIDIDLQYQPYLETPPLAPEQLQAHATSNDSGTMIHWKEKWISNTRANKEFFQSFGPRSLGQLHNINQHRPAIIIGSGPSLKLSLPDLKLNQELEKPILTISCLHNFGYFQDEGVKVDYYLSLDSGEVVIKDISEGRNEADYWDQTKDKKLIAYTGSHPDLFKKWQGEIYLFNTLIPDESIRKDIKEIEHFTNYVSSGGNALGACMYVAKEYFGSPTIMFVGADFCFSYDNQFHSYKTGYDQPSGIVMHPDVFGIPRKAWPSYLNFKFWFDRIAMTIPGNYINCSFGLLGSYLGGNIRHFQYMSLETAMVPYVASERLTLVDNKTNETTKLKLNDFYKNTQNPIDLVFY